MQPRGQRRFPTKPARVTTLKLLGADSDGRLLFLDPPTGLWTRLDPAAGVFLSMCDGRHTIEDLAKTFGADGLPGRNVTLAERLTDSLWSLGLLEGSPRVTFGQDPRSMKRVTLHLTHACNLRCRYCFVNAGRRSRDELTPPEILALIDDLAAHDVEWIGFTGGEPLLRREVFEFASRARSRGLATGLASNGTLINDENAKTIRELFSDVQISLDGLAQENDAFRGAGCFRRASRGIRSLVKAGVPVAISATITAMNVHRLDAFFDYLWGLGVQHFFGVRLTRMGKGKDRAIPRLSRKSFLDTLLSLADRWAGRILVRQFETLLPRSKERRMNCGRGHGELEIGPNGDVYPCCGWFTENHAPIGSIRKGSLNTIYSDSPVLSSIRSRSVLDDSVCGVCDFRHVCGGRCPSDLVSSPEACEYADLYRWILVGRSDLGGEELFYH